MRRILLPFTLSAVLLGLSAAASAGESIHFNSPSGKIHCTGDSRLEFGKDGWWGVTCEIRDSVENIRPQQKRPSVEECPLDWGNSFSLEANGRPTVDCRGDTSMKAGSPTLAYGKTIRGRGWQCTSHQDGMLCKNRSGHGFKLSSKLQQLF